MPEPLQDYTPLISYVDGYNESVFDEYQHTFGGDYHSGSDN